MSAMPARSMRVTGQSLAARGARARAHRLRHRQTTCVPLAAALGCCSWHRPRSRSASKRTCRCIMRSAPGCASSSRTRAPGTACPASATLSRRWGVGADDRPQRDRRARRGGARRAPPWLGDVRAAASRSCASSASPRSPRTCATAASCPSAGCLPSTSSQPTARSPRGCGSSPATRSIGSPACVSGSGEPMAIETVLDRVGARAGPRTHRPRRLAVRAAGTPLPARHRARHA